MTKERIHGLIQYYEALGAWYMVNTLRKILGSMIVLLIAMPAHSDEYWRKGDTVYSNTGQTWVMKDGAVYDDQGKLVMSAKEVEKARQQYVTNGNSVAGRNGTLCLFEDNHAICQKGVQDKGEDENE